MNLTILGNGYTANFLSDKALKEGFKVSIISRNIIKPKNNIHYYNFSDQNNVLKILETDNIISTIPPNENESDPIISKYAESICKNKNKIIYLSATSVYGNGQVDEYTKPNPQNHRGNIRLQAEKSWSKISQKSSIFRISGIYGPQRNSMINYIEGNNKIIVKDGYISNRIHVEDLASIIISFMTAKHNDKIINVSDQNLVSNIDAIRHVANKLKLKKPQIVEYSPDKVSEMARSFYETNRIVTSKVIGNHFKYIFKYPDYKKALLELTKQLIKV